MATRTALKEVKGGKTEDVPDVVKRTMRGTEYVIRELTVPEYKECLKAATDPEGLTPFQDLLDQMVLRAVKPSPAAGSKPMSYPIYRTLENIVNVMHFREVPEDGETEDEEDGFVDSPEEGAEEEKEAVPNS